MKFWEGFCRALGHEELITDERFNTPENRLENYDLLIPLIRQTLAERTGQEWLAILEKEGVPCAPVNTLGQALANPQVQHRGMVAEVTHPREGTVKLAGNPVKTVGLEDDFKSPPELGGHTREVLTEILGYSEARIQQLEAEAVIGIFREGESG